MYVDGRFHAEVDTYAAVDQPQSVLYTTSGLPAGTHTLTIEVTGTKNAASGGAWVWVDAFEISP